MKNTWQEDKGSFKEADIYIPLKIFFEGLGYEVKGEVKGLDMALVKGDTLYGVELKKAFNMTLLHQALKAQERCGGVFVAVPRGAFAKNQKNILHILEKLNIGFATVAMDSPTQHVEVHLLPHMPKSRNSKASRALLDEFNGRSFDENLGGSTQTKIMTAYRERALQVVCVLDVAGKATAAQLVKDYGCHKNTGHMMRSNPYGWFEKVEKGVFALSPLGADALVDPMFKKIVQFYREGIEKLPPPALTGTPLNEGGLGDKSKN